MGIVCTLFASYDGVRNIITPSYVEVGSNNMIVGPVWLLVLLVSFLFAPALRSFTTFTGITKHRLLGAFFFVAFMAMFVASSGNQFFLVKAARDIFYLAYFSFVAFWFDSVYFKRQEGAQFVRYFLRWHFYSFLFLTFLAAVLGKFDDSDRLMGAQLTASIFGNYVPVLCFFFLVSNPSRFLEVIAIFASVVLVILSGTRTALVVLILLVVYFYSFYRSNRVGLGSLLPVFFLGLIAAASTFFLEGSSENVRSLSADDVEGGSVATRFYWYEKLFDSIVRSGGWGGFGAGAAEADIGYITHADFLRFWYDYGLAFPVVVFIFVLGVIFHRAKLSFLTLIDVSVFVLVMVNFTFHNLFQAPNLLFETVLLGVLVSRRSKLIKSLK